MGGMNHPHDGANGSTPGDPNNTRKAVILCPFCNGGRIRINLDGNAAFESLAVQHSQPLCAELRDRTAVEIATMVLDPAFRLKARSGIRPC